MRMEVDEFLEFVQIATEKEVEDRLYQEWLTLYPRMATKEFKFMSFAEYKEKSQGKNIDKRPAGEIIAEIEEAHRKMREEVGNGYI